jgi:hypothetical protein
MLCALLYSTLSNDTTTDSPLSALPVNVPNDSPQVYPDLPVDITTDNPLFSLWCYSNRRSNLLTIRSELERKDKSTTLLLCSNNKRCAYIHVYIYQVRETYYALNYT